MAKSQPKKTGTDETESKKKPAAAAKKPPAASAAKTKPAAGAKKATLGPTQAPLIDTDLAASAAASMILNRAMTGAGPAASGGSSAQPAAKKESSAFKNLKDNLNKHSSTGLGGILGNTAQQKKSNQPFGGGKQVGRNQTFGADVNRTGVPRRTPG